MEVTFYKLVERRISAWEAVRGKRTRVPGSTMALGRGDLPHDLVQLIVEATLGLDDGFWGSVAAGATFKSTGRKRTKPGRDVIRRNKVALDASEHIAGAHVRRWASGEETPVAAQLDRFAARWDGLDDGDGLVVTWPGLEDRGVRRIEDSAVFSFG